MTAFILKIWRVEQVCLFELSWGAVNTLSARLNYLETLTLYYDQWQSAYLNFYRKLRARPGIQVSLPQPETDWRSELVQAEATFLTEFHYWLNSAELVEIRRTISAIAAGSEPVDLFIRSGSLELVKLPWESWQIGTEFGMAHPIRILRTSAQLQAQISKPVKRSRARILAIFGDETGLDFETERNELNAYQRIAEVEMIGWRKPQQKTEVMQEICQKLIDPKGWDILFFAGHSNEAQGLGGELAIAPDTSIFVSEIAEPLKVAKANGLQFAIFNSCNGVNIAESLIDLGLNQVAIMREPIHDQVAKDFLIRFLYHLSQSQEVQSATQSACRFLKLEQNLNYPSAYLIPSLFSHPQVQPFRLKSRWNEVFRAWKPTRFEAISLSTLTILSLVLPLQTKFIDLRQAAQVIYQSSTKQNRSSNAPPVLLVQVNEESIRKDQIKLNTPDFDRAYLAQLVQKSSDLNAKTIGIDYLLFRPTDNDERFAQTIQTVQAKGTQLVFATAPDQDPSHWITSAIPIKNRIDGDMDLFGDPAFYAPVMQPGNPNPLSYQLVWLNSNKRFHWTALHHRQAIANLSALIQQMWFHPLIDFSVPLNQVYQPIPAWKLLRNPNLPNIQNQIVLIAPDGQVDAGVTRGEDYFTTPIALNLHQELATKIPGGRIHAYLMQNLLHQRLILPVPDLWMLGIAALLGKGTFLWLKQDRTRLAQNATPKKPLRSVYWLGIPVLYAIVSFQTYTTFAILLPVFFPIAAYCLYIVPSSLKRV